MLSKFGRGSLWIAAGVFLLLIVAVIVWLASPHGTPQQNLIDEATQELSKVKTIQGRLDITQKGTTLQQKLWVQRPGFLRTETEVGPKEVQGTIVVLNDKEGWVYSPALDMATVVDRASYQDHLAGDTGAGSLLERMPDLVLGALQNETQVHIGDSASVAGRSARLVEIVIAPNDPSFPAGVLQVWLDDEYSYPLAWRDSNGRELRFTSVTFNADIDPLTFVFYPPPGASVHRIKPTQ
jgi:outer membrane lipoprotein-sorting protein